MYSTLICFPNTSQSLIQKLQAIQNSAVRIATGSVKMASIDHLHEESEMLPVQDQLFLICFRYLTGALQANNPSHSVVTPPSGSRYMKQTLQSRFLHNVAPHLAPLHSAFQFVLLKFRIDIFDSFKTMSIPAR